MRDKSDFELRLAYKWPHKGNKIFFTKPDTVDGTAKQVTESQSSDFLTSDTDKLDTGTDVVREKDNEKKRRMRYREWTTPQNWGKKWM